MDPYKTSKLNNAIQKTLSELLQVAVKDPRISFVTINGVELNRDHTVAKVFYSVMGSDEDKERSQIGLKKARGFMQGRIGRALRLRQTPELRFIFDSAFERSIGLASVLHDLEEKGEFVSDADRLRKMTLEDLVPPADLIAALGRAESIWVVPHWNPDPDAMGSALALAEALEKFGCQTTLFRYPEPPIGLKDLPGFDNAVPSDRAAELVASDPPDTLVLVDCHRLDRTGLLADPLAGIANAWCVDHHLVSGRRAPLPGWNEPKACSASTLVFRVISVLAQKAAGRGEPFDFSQDMATCLYAGLLNDTGGFRFPNTMPFSFELARRLAEMGVDTAAISRLTLHRHRREGVELLKKVLATMEYTAANRILSLRVDQTMLAETGASLADTEGFVNIATAVEGVQYVVFLKELEPGTWRVSMRAPGGGDVQEVAARHGGGGHRQAAGCTMTGTGDEISATLVGDLAATL